MGGRTAPFKASAGSAGLRQTAGRRTGPSVGSMNQKLDPRPGIDSAPMVPPCISTNFLQRASPSPVPCAWRLAELSTWLNS